MKRREFLRTSVASTAIATTALAAANSLADSGDEEGESTQPFRMKFAPHFGMFRHSAGDDPVDQLKFAADQGFTAWEDNGMKNRSVEEQTRIAQAMDELEMEMGVFVANADFGKVTFAGNNQENRKRVVQNIKDSVEVAKRVRAKWITVVPGNYHQGLEWGYQTANCVDLLRECAEVCEPHDLVIVLEPLNWWRNHAGVFLHKVPQAFQICRAVDSPACKILFDIYHQQIEEGNLIHNIDLAWSEIGYFQIGDNPGRNEPNTGEINYRNLFRHIQEKGYSGILGMEHGNSKPEVEGERAVIAAYRSVDPANSGPSSAADGF